MKSRLVLSLISIMSVKYCDLHSQKYQNFVCMFSWLSQFFNIREKKIKAQTLKYSLNCVKTDVSLKAILACTVIRATILGTLCRYELCFSYSNNDAKEQWKGCFWLCAPFCPATTLSRAKSHFFIFEEIGFGSKASVILMPRQGRLQPRAHNFKGPLISTKTHLLR